MTESDSNSGLLYSILSRENEQEKEQEEEQEVEHKEDHKEEQVAVGSQEVFGIVERWNKLERGLER